MAKNHKRLIVLVQSIEQPRIIKKIIEMSEVYEHVDVYGFDRKIHSVNNYKVLDAYNNVKVRIVSSFTDGSYVTRIGGYLKLLWILWATYGISPKNLYVVGLDIRMCCVFLVNTKIGYVISDLMWLYLPNPKKKILKFIDTRLARASDTVYFTSRGFYDKYYRDYVPESRAEITENKLATYGKVKPLDRLITDRIRIAYIGAFRYDHIIRRLLKVVAQNPDLILNFYGDGTSEIVALMKQHAETYPNITFNGAFRNPDDLQRIYEENNLNFVVYNNTMENEQIAMPNKYYESGFFNVPIVCAENTYVGQRVVENRMGWAIGIEEKAIAEFLNSLTVAELHSCHEAIKKLDKHDFSC